MSLFTMGLLVSVAVAPSGCIREGRVAPSKPEPVPLLAPELEEPPATDDESKETLTPFMTPTSGSVDITKFRGGHLTDVVLSPDGNRAYAIAHGTDNIFVIDTANYMVKDVIYLPSKSSFGAMPYRAAITGDGKTLYTANMGDDTVSVIDLTQNRVVATIGVRDIPWDINISKDGKWAFVAVGDWGRWERSKPGLAVIDTTTRAVKKTIRFPERNLPFAVTSTHDGSHVLVATSNPRRDGWHARVHVIDARRLRTRKRIDLGLIRGNWGKFALTADDNTLYLSGGQNVNRIFVIDLRAAKLKEEIEVPTEATEISLSPNETLLYALSPGSHQLFEVDLKSKKVATVLDFNTILRDWMSGDTRGLDITPDGRFVYVGAFEAEAVVVGDLRSKTLASIVKVNARRSELWDIAISPDGKWVYVGENVIDPDLEHSVIIIDAERNAVADRIFLDTHVDRERGEVHGGSVGLAITQDGKFLYVAQLGCRVAEIDLVTRKVTREFDVLPPGDGCGAVWDVAPVPNQNKLYAATELGGGRGGHVAVLDLTTGTVVQRIALDWLPQMLTVSPDGSKLYVSRYGKQALLGERFNPADIEWFTRAALTVIDTATNQVVKTVSMKETYAPAGRIDLLEINKAGTLVYFYTSRDTVGVLKTATNRIIRNISLMTGRHGPVGVHPTDVALLSDGSRAYIPCGDSYLLAVVDTRKAKPVHWVKLGLEPVAVVVTPDDRFAYITNRRSEEVSVVDLTTNQVVDSISIRH